MNLEQLNKSELIVLIRQMLQVQPNLEALLEAALPGGDRGRTTIDPESYHRQIASVFQRAGDDRNAARRVVADIDMAMDTGDGFLDVSDHANACIVYQAVLQGLLGHYNMMLDNQDYLWNVIHQCVDGLADCLAARDGEVTVRERALQALFEMYCFHMDIGQFGLAEVAEDFILELATGEEKNAIAGRVRAAVLAATGKYDDYQRQEYGRFLLNLETDDLDDDAFLEICRESGRLNDLVDRLLTLGRLDEALAEADRAGDSDLPTLAGVFRKHGCDRRLEPLLGKRIETTRVDGLVEWLKERYAERGELAEALVLAQRLLEQRPGLDRYRSVRELSRQLGGWQALRSELLAKWAAARQYGMLTDIHLEEGDIDLALKSVRQQRQVFSHGGDRLMRVARAAAETRPRASLEIYREQAERLVEARGRDNYQQACVYLTKVRDLYRRMSQGPAWTDFMAGFRERHRRLPALQDELGNAGL
ncbi:MAG: hypothetical protein F4Y37_07600 [Caldilineaceae bacterium SB0664_bin_22]|nr:hypothetical protein [Caldilineaceae bacterium SB0664_bin_22]